jgi:hypothetical protein
MTAETSEFKQRLVVAEKEMAVIVNLSRFTGTLSAGIVVLSDQGLPAAERRRVPTGLDNDPHALGVLSAALTMATMNRDTNTVENRFLATSAYLAVSTGMVYRMHRGASHQTQQGSDWIDTVNEGPTQPQFQYVENLL